MSENRKRPGSESQGGPDPKKPRLGDASLSPSNLAERRKRPGTESQGGTDPKKPRIGETLSRRLDTALAAGQSSFEVDTRDPIPASIKIPMENGLLYDVNGNLVSNLDDDPPYGHTFQEEFRRRHEILEKNPDYKFVRILAGKMNASPLELMDTDHLRDLERREEQLQLEIAAERSKLNMTMDNRVAHVQTLRERQSDLLAEQFANTQAELSFLPTVMRWSWLVSYTGFLPTFAGNGATVNVLSSHPDPLTPLPYWLLTRELMVNYNEPNPANVPLDMASLALAKTFWQIDAPGNVTLRRYSLALNVFHALDRRMMVNSTERMDYQRDLYMLLRDYVFSPVLRLLPDARFSPGIAPDEVAPWEPMTSISAILGVIMTNIETRMAASSYAHDEEDTPVADLRDGKSSFPGPIREDVLGATEEDIRQFRKRVNGALEKYFDKIPNYAVATNATNDGSMAFRFLALRNYLNINLDLNVSMFDGTTMSTLPRITVGSIFLCQYTSSVDASLTFAINPTISFRQLFKAKVTIDFQPGHVDLWTASTSVLLGRFPSTMFADFTVVPRLPDKVDGTVILTALMSLLCENVGDCFGNLLRCKPTDTYANNMKNAIKLKNVPSNASLATINFTGLVGLYLASFNWYCTHLRLDAHFTKELLRSTIHHDLNVSTLFPLVLNTASLDILNPMPKKPHIFSNLDLTYAYAILEFYDGTQAVTMTVDEYDKVKKDLDAAVKAKRTNIPASKVVAKIDADNTKIWVAHWKDLQYEMTRFGFGSALSVLHEYLGLTQLTLKTTDYADRPFFDLVESILDTPAATSSVSVYSKKENSDLLRLFEVMVLFVADYYGAANVSLTKKARDMSHRIDEAQTEISKLVKADYKSAGQRIDEAMANMHRPSAMWSSLPEILGRIVLTARASSGITSAWSSVTMRAVSPLAGVPLDVLTGNTLPMPNRDHISDDASQPGAVLALANAFAELVAATINATQQRFPSAYNTREQNLMSANDLPLRTKALGRFRAVPTGVPREWAVFMVM